MKEDHIVIAGAGPVGAVGALAAARRGFKVTLIDAAEFIDNDPRAATFHPSTLEMIDGIGIYEEFERVGLTCRYFDFWDKSAKRLVARFDHSILQEETRFPHVVQTEQHKLVKIVFDELEASPNAEVRLGCSFLRSEQTDSGVKAFVIQHGEADVIEGDWLVGCDGGRSRVRKQLGIEFEGFTWPEKFVVLTTTFDFADAMDCSYRSYMAAPGDWTNLFKVAGDDMQGRWRMVFPTAVGETDDQAMSDESCRERLDRVWSAPGVFEGLVHKKLYNVHQRVAAEFRRGRTFLAGDAAHVNNPIGGLGLNCGIHDVVDLVDTLTEYQEQSDDGLLGRYEQRRRELNIRYVQEQTVTNKKRLEETDEKIRQQRLDEIQATAEDSERARAFLRRSSLLQSVKDSKAIV